MNTSIYANYADHNAAAITSRARAARASGDGMGWGQEGHTLAEAAADMGAIVVCEVSDGLLCELGDRLYLLSDVNGPWAVEVATAPITAPPVKKRMYPLEVVRIWAPNTGNKLDDGTDVHTLSEVALAISFARAWDTPNTNDLRVLAVEQARRWGELEASCS